MAGMSVFLPLLCTHMEMLTQGFSPGFKRPSRPALPIFYKSCRTRLEMRIQDSHVRFFDMAAATRPDLLVFVCRS